MHLLSRIQYINPILLTTVALFIATIGFSQSNKNDFVVLGKIVINRFYADSLWVEIEKDSSLFLRDTLDTSGLFEFHLPFSAEYTITFGRPSFCTRSVTINTNIPNEKTGGDFAPFSFQLEIFPMINAEINTLIELSSGRIVYSPKVDEFDFIVNQERYQLLGTEAIEKAFIKALEKMESKTQP